MLGEKQADWTKNDKNPWHVLVEKLSTNGYYECGWAPGTVEWFGTKHAVPALIGKPWPIIQLPRATPPEQQPTEGGGSQSPTPTTTIQTPNSDNQTPTTTPTFTTSTTYNFTTSTPITIDSPTSTLTRDTQNPTLPITQNTNNKTPKNIQYPISNIKTTQKQLNNETIEQSPTLTLSSAPPESPSEPANPVSSATKKLFAGSSIAAGGLGLYLAWRLLQTVV